MLYLGGISIFYVVDKAPIIYFIMWLKYMTENTLLQSLRMCCIDAYFGPFDSVVQNAGNTFMGARF